MSLSSLVALALATCSLAACTSVATPPPAVERHATSRDGLSIAYEEHGELGEGGTGAPLIVFVHGWCGERGFWRGTMESLAPRHHVLALDLGGHGASGHAGRAQWTLDALADDVVAVIEAETTEAARAGASAPEDVILVGHSMGAPVALLAAPRLAPRVRGVIGVESLHRADFAYPPGYLERAARDLEANFPRALEASIRSALPKGTEPELVTWIEAHARRTDPTAAVGLLRGLEEFQLTPALAQVGVPVRVINAAGSEPATDVEANRDVCDFDATLLENVGHFPMLERPREFLPALERWIDALAVPRLAASR